MLPNLWRKFGSWDFWMNKTIAGELKAGRMVATKTTGVSMRPLLYERKTTAIIEPLRRELQVGELPIYQRPDGYYVIHRVVGVDPAHYYTRGDNCTDIEKIPKSWALGVVVEILRGNRRIRVTDRGYRFYVAFWRWITPVRILYYRVRGKIRSLRKSSASV